MAKLVTTQRKRNHGCKRVLRLMFGTRWGTKLQFFLFSVPSGQQDKYTQLGRVDIPVTSQ